MTVDKCPECGSLLQSLDLPCSRCSSGIDQSDAWAAHEFSKTFRTRHLIRPRTDEFVRQLNVWLAHQPGLLHVSFVVHRDRQGTVRGVTLTCVASSLPVLVTFQFHRLVLLRKSVGWSHVDPGEALNTWAENHPDRTRVGHVVLSAAGVPTECWLLSKGSLPDATVWAPAEKGAPSSSPNEGLWQQVSKKLLKLRQTFGAKSPSQGT